MGKELAAFSGRNTDDRPRRRIKTALERAGIPAETASELADAIADIRLDGVPRSLLLSDRAAAELLDVSRATFWRRVSDGTLPQPVKLGGATRWRRDDLLAALDRLAG
jgi:predicted DNA-binding transcriptional regulator AlpA